MDFDKEYLDFFKDIILEFHHLNHGFGSYTKTYLFATENVKGYSKLIDFKDKDVLTIGGSGDQMLNAYLYGAKSVTCFDIGELCKLPIDTKVEAIKHFKLEWFKEFFCSYNAFDPEMYKKLEKYLLDGTRDLMDFMYSLHQQYAIKGLLFQFFESEYSFISQYVNGYLTEKTYQKLSQILNERDKPQVIRSDITELADKLGDRKFDAIILSNIADYTDLLFKDNELENYAKIIESLTEHLNPGGVIQVAYLYHSYWKKQNEKKEIYILQKRKEYFPHDEYQYSKIKAYETPELNLKRPRDTVILKKTIK